MAYPTVSAPYGLAPINLIGSQVFAGGVRQLPIQYNYATAIFNGDFVVLSRGNITRATVETGTGVNQVTGVFVGCSYTDPNTKQKVFKQYYPGSVTAGDIMAYVVEDPDTVFKVAVCSSGTTIASGNPALVGTNGSFINNTGDANTGNSRNAFLAPADTPATTILPARVIDVVPDTAYSFTATGSSSSTTITLTGSGAPQAIPVGTAVSYVASNGQLIQTGSFVDTAAAAGATSVTLNAAIAVPGAITAIPSASTIVFTVYPEILVKVNLLIHGYYSSATA